MVKSVNPVKTLTLLFTLLFSLYGVASEWKVPAKEKAKANPIKPDEKSLAAGKDLFEKKCQSCHGETGKGDGKMASMLKEPPGDLTQLGDQTDGELFYKISTGKEPMPGLGKVLSADDRWHVVNYVRALTKKK